MTEYHFIDQKELIGIVSAKPQNFAWFLGAGASRSAGLPSATDLLWDLKRHYYCREENQEITRQDVQNDAVRDRIQSFMEFARLSCRMGRQGIRNVFRETVRRRQGKAAALPHHSARGRQGPACSWAPRSGGADIAGPLPRRLQHKF